MTCPPCFVLLAGHPSLLSGNRPPGFSGNYQLSLHLFLSPPSQLFPINILTFSNPTIFFFNVPHTHTNTRSLQTLPFLSFPCPDRQYQRVAFPHPPPFLSSCPLHLTLVYPIGSFKGALSNIPGDLQGTKLEGPVSIL